MTINEEVGDGDVGSFGLEGDVAGSIRAIDRTAAGDPIGTASSHVRPRQADLDNSDSGEGNPLLAESAAVTIDAPIGKLRRMQLKRKVENAATVQIDGNNTTYRKGPNEESMRSQRVEDAVVGPPDGGLRAWMIMIGSFTINGVLFSIINTYSLIYPELQKRLTEAGETEVSSKAGVKSFRFAASKQLASLLTSGETSGFCVCVCVCFQVEWLYLTYSVMFGLGASLAYTPSLAILGHYFKKYLGLVNGIVTAGSSIFTTLLPSLMELLIWRFGLEGTLRSMAVLTAIIMACAILFKPIPLITSTAQEDEPRHKTKSIRSRLKEFVNVSIWKKKRYVVWASSIPLALFGYFVPYVHIGKFVAMTFKDADSKLPVMCIGITSGIGRLIFGYIADLPKVNRIFLQQISFLIIGILTMLLPVTESFIVLLVISLGMGLFDGCFISLLGPIAFDICGRSGATQAIGFLLGMCSIPLTVGPPIAGLLYDHTGSYKLPFLLAGVPPIVGALTMFLIRCVKQNDDGSENNPSPESPPSKTDCQNGRARSNGFSPMFIERKCEQAVQERYRTMCKNLQLSQHHHIKPRGELQNGLAQKSCKHEYTNNYRYSESVPLLHGDWISRRPSTSFS
ncbi:monocarboxylate transporter 10 [Pogonomyrmex barbatus]|uniref:Monocarboxylate transporter 10 n=1 Tax=Pogonomyrmex barbatus TaxID=144034 RepID=A0A6I9XH21_9HYME|nr:monocarboxylate transporter 10 [Pogonomyrmex barbatus]